MSINTGQWFDGCDHDIVLFDDIEASSCLRISLFFKLTDRYPHQVRKEKEKLQGVNQALTATADKTSTINLKPGIMKHKPETIIYKPETINHK